MIGKTKRYLLRFLMLMLGLMLIIVLFCACNYDYIFVDYVTSYDIGIQVDQNGFDASYTIGEIKKNLQAGTFLNSFGEMEGLYDKLSKYDDNTRIVFSVGSGIKYFFIPKHEYDGFIRVKYQAETSENKIYIYTTDYWGSMIDISNY